MRGKAGNAIWKNPMMTNSPSDITLLASDLPEYLADRGVWGVGSGGPETSTLIAELIARWDPSQRPKDSGFRTRDISR